VKKLYNVFYSKYCPSLATTFFHLSGSIRIPRRKKSVSFEAIHESTHFLVFLVYLVFYMKTTSAWVGRSEQVVIKRSNIRRVWRMGDFPFHCFQVYFDGLCDMRSSIVMLENYFVVSLLVLRSFFFQCSA